MWVLWIQTHVLMHFTDLQPLLYKYLKQSNGVHVFVGGTRNEPHAGMLVVVTDLVCVR